MKKLKLNNKLLMNAVISALIVQQAPRFVNDFLFKSNPLSGIALTSSGAVAGVIASILLKKPDIATLSIAFAGSDILNELLSTTLLGGSPVADFISVNNGNPQLADFTNNPTVMPTVDYAKNYEVLN